MNEKNRNLVVRIVSALVLLPVVIFLLVKGGFYSAGLMAVGGAICTGEYYAITQKQLTPAAWLGIVLSGLFPLYPVWAPPYATNLAFWSAASFLFFAWGYHLVRGQGLTDAPTRVSHLVTGLLYGGIGMYAISSLRVGASGFEWVVCALIITWGNDTSAYFAGRFLGKHKLYPEVSPNKTWEGFAGGMLGSIGGMFAARALFFPELTPLDCVLVGVAGGILGPMGDLCESMLKRAYQVKDSGKIIPGHGGVLDRVDALLFNGPMVFLYAHFVRNWL